MFDWRPRPIRPFPGSIVSASITCLAVSGNTATFVGPVEFRDPFGGVRLGVEKVRMADNGGPGSGLTRSTR